ncbi:hypothetical protein HYX16_06585, partial [Candidatus Woesearchaeota archaeon]|nr:hypothetical protein [Candidatus Woesearchaeota archaeon]
MKRRRIKADYRNNKEKTDLVRMITKLKTKKKAVINQIKRINYLHKKEKLSNHKYELKLNKILSNLSLESWLENNEEKTRELNVKLSKITAKNYIFKEAIFLLFILLFSLSYFYLDPSITGLEVIDNLANQSIFGIPLENISLPISNLTNETLAENTTIIENLTLPAGDNTNNEFTIPLENFIPNETILGNLTEIILIENNTNGIIYSKNITDNLIQLKAEINKLVEWKLRTKNKTIELPLESTNIEIYKEVFSLTSNVTKEKAKLKNVFGINSVSDKKLIEIDELNETQLEVIYFTKAPYSIESFLEKSFSKNGEVLIKNITIKSDSELHYSNVLSYTDISPEIQNINQVKLFHYVIKNISIGNETNGSDYETVKE